MWKYLHRSENPEQVTCVPCCQNCAGPSHIVDKNSTCHKRDWKRKKNIRNFALVYIF